MILLATYSIIADYRGFTVVLLKFKRNQGYQYTELKTKRSLDEAERYMRHHKKHATKQGDKEPYPVHLAVIYLKPSIEDMHVYDKDNLALLCLVSVARERKWKVADLAFAQSCNDPEFFAQIVEVGNIFGTIPDTSSTSSDRRYGSEKLQLDELILTYKSHIKEVILPIHKKMLDRKRDLDARCKKLDAVIAEFTAARGLTEQNT